MKTIVVTSYYCFPENTPRAFRTNELTKFFIKNGFQVKLFVPYYSEEINNQIKAYFTGAEVFFVKNGSLTPAKKIPTKGTSTAKQKPRKASPLVSRLRKVASYFMGTSDIGYSLDLAKSLKANIKSDYDYLLAVSLPVPTVIGSGIFMNQFKAKKAIAEYGDPYYYSPFKKRFFIHYFIEKFALSKFDYVTITTEKIFSAFTNFKQQDSIKVIPQGFDFSKVVIDSNHTQSTALTFAYAGLFYEKERDPTAFLNFLVSIKDKVNFQFIIYTDKKMSINPGYSLVQPFESILGEKLVVHDLVDRLDCIKYLSRCDFLINIETRDANPSKLIDYKLTKRPVLNIDKKGTFKEVFHQFSSTDYTNDYIKDIDIERFNIENVGKKFVHLFEDNN